MAEKIKILCKTKKITVKLLLENATLTEILYMI